MSFASRVVPLTGGAAAAWTPLALISTGQAVAWWDPSQGVTQSGGLVSAWADRIGGYTPVQGTGSVKPVYTATAINSLVPGVTFDGVDDQLNLVGVPAAIPTGTTVGWMFCIADQTAAVADTTVRIPFAYGNASGARRGFERNVVSAANRGAFGSGTSNSVEGTVDLSGINAFLGEYNATNFVARINGVDAAGATTSSTSTTRLRFGCSSAVTPGNFWAGAVGHTLVGTGALALADKQRLEAWALWSCGKQALLPSSHPYATQRP